MLRRLTPLALACLLAAGAAGCGSSGKKAAEKSPQVTALNAMRVCFRHQGYAVSPESPATRRTAPRRFEFVSIWNLLNPDRIALAVTVSKTPAGAKRANTWTQKLNDRIGKGAVHAPVVRFGRVNVLWTTDPDKRDTDAIYGCVRPSPLAA